MVRITVKVIMELASIFGCHEQVISLPENSRLINLLDTLEERYGQPFTEILHRDQNRGPHSNLIFLLNGRNVSFLDGFETRLADGDELFFLTPVGGG